MIKLIAVLSMLATFSLQAKTISIEEAIQSAKANSQQVKALKIRQKQFDADLQRVSGEFGLRFESFVAFAPIYEETGDALRSEVNTDSWGAFILGNVGAQYPLLTWGRKKKYMDAIEHGRTVSKAEERLTTNRLIFEVKQAYWGVVLGRKVLELIEDGKADLAKARENLGKKAKKRDRYRLEIFEQKLLGTEAEVTQLLETARSALAFRMGLNLAEAELPVPKDRWLKTSGQELKPLKGYIAEAMAKRPEFEQLRVGIEAKRLLASAENKGRLPVVGLGIQYKYAHTAQRTRQQSVFAYDPYNLDALEAGIGVKWDFNWGLQSAKAARYRAEAEELEAKQLYARNGITVQVSKAYHEFKAARARMQAGRESYKSAKKWLRREMIGVGTGLGDTKNLVEAYTAWAEAARDNFESQYAFLEAEAKLAEMIGAETL